MMGPPPVAPVMVFPVYSGWFSGCCKSALEVSIYEIKIEKERKEEQLSLPLNDYYLHLFIFMSVSIILFYCTGIFS